MDIERKATRVEPLRFDTPPMRAFHMAWLAFFLCFFGWFGLAPMLAVVRDDLGLTTDQIVTTNMVAVAGTVLMRIFVGWLCDKLGPRTTYTWLLVLGSLPVMAVGLSSSYQSFLLMRMAIGVIGASFVITQFHTSVMFAPNCVGTANAMTAGWGNSGAGATHILMPLLFAAVLAVVGSEALAWRLAMLIPGAALFCRGLALMLFSRMTSPAHLVVCLVVTGVFVHASCGATFGVVPFINGHATGAVSGIVGAGGNALAVALMFLFKPGLTGLAWPAAFLLTGTIVTVGSFLVLTVRFSPEAERRVRSEMRRRLTEVGEPEPAGA